MQAPTFALALVAMLGAAFFGLNPRSARAETLGSKVNSATWSGPVSAGAVTPLAIKAQILLDRLRLSPGVIDGRLGENTRKAIRAFQRRHDLAENGQLDRDTWSALVNAAPSDPVLGEYEISKKDVDGPFIDAVPDSMERQAKLKRLSFTGPRELLAEKFHMDEDLLARLNPGAAFDRAGTSIAVAQVRRTPDRQKPAVDYIEVDKSRRTVRAVGPDGKDVAVYPATVGSESRPAPSGTLQIKRIASHPTYHYSPKLNFKGVGEREFTIAPGPNNPVGSVWIELNKEGYGIHGTPDPSAIDKTFSHGCIRLTNWDAEDLAGLVKKGMKVEFLD
jgi:lipoprotein-anchoring transpeptidase ErfK/SrfK